MWWPGAALTAQAMTDLPYRPMPAAYELPLPGEPIPSQFKIGALCKREHDWTGNGESLRYAKPKGACVLCARIDALKRKERLLTQDPDYKAKRAAYMRRRRATLGRPSRSKYGLPYMPLPDVETRAMQKAIKCAGRLPSVAQLVYEQQFQHWRRHPQDRAEFVRQRAQWRHHWNYAMSLQYRLYHRSKSKRRKAQQRGSTTILLSPDQMWRRWVGFDFTCAYCGSGGDLQVEHVVPISKGGEHHLGNIVPACRSCNYSKARSDAWQWYRSQPFFDETRWQRITTVLANSQPDFDQLSIL